jgi:Group II intron, maturase-specific domain
LNIFAAIFLALLIFEFLRFKISKQGKVKWTEKSMKWDKQIVKEITRRNRGVSAKDVIVELRRYVMGWANYLVLEPVHESRKSEPAK